LAQRLRTGLELRLDFEDDVVLVDRGKHRRDDALTECVAERVVDCFRQYPVA